MEARNGGKYIYFANNLGAAKLNISTKKHFIFELSILLKYTGS